MTDLNQVPQASGESTSSSLLQRVKDQDPAAWQRLVDLYGPLVFSWCFQRQLQQADRDEIFQEVFKAVAAGIARFNKDQSGGTFRGWLRILTRNKVADHLRRRKKAVQATGGSDAQGQLAQVPDPDGDLDEGADASQESALLHRALNLIQGEFETRTWKAFWRVTVEGHDSAAVAKELGISLNAVYKAKSRVLQRLRQELGDLEDLPS